MTAPAVLAPWHRDYPGLIAGSMYAAGPGDRIAAATALADAGLAIHADVMAVGEGLPEGVSLADLRAAADRVVPTRIDVHLIGSTDFVDDVLDDVLATRPARVFLPWTAFTAGRAAAIRAADTGAWITVWDEWDGVTNGPHWPATPDGVLVMLIEPGTSDRCRIARLNLVTAYTTDHPEIPVMVDGGVTQDIAPLCVTAGVTQMVVGRALLNSNRRETP